MKTNKIVVAVILSMQGMALVQAIGSGSASPRNHSSEGDVAPLTPRTQAIARLNQSVANLTEYVTRISGDVAGLNQKIAALAHARKASSLVESGSASVRTAASAASSVADSGNGGDAGAGALNADASDVSTGSSSAAPSGPGSAVVSSAYPVRTVAALAIAAAVVYYRNDILEYLRNHGWIAPKQTNSEVAAALLSAEIDKK